MKPRITIRLFDRLSVHCNDRDLLLHSSGNAKEILCYLIVNRRASVPREALAGLISRDSPTEKSRKALRQALWQLRDGLSAEHCSCAAYLLRFGEGWAQFVASDNVWLDVAEFERAAALAHPSRRDGDPGLDARRLNEAVELYRGDFLQGWYQEWCLEERERLRQIYLGTLDALVSDCESRGDINAGIAYAGRALHADPARECTHRALMRLHRLAGDRASALHQYGRCVETLRHQLNVGPDDETRELEREIRSGHPLSSEFAGPSAASAKGTIPERSKFASRSRRPKFQ